MYKIYIVEDDEKILKLVNEKLRQYGYDVVEVSDYENIKEEFISNQPDLVLLDVNLPNYDGFFWCRQIRTISKVPIVFISARFSDMDQVMAIESGGDDYIIKPFSFEVLLAKIKSILRRSYGEYSLEDSLDILDIGGLYLNNKQFTVEYGDNKIDLSKREFGLLWILSNSIGEIVKRETLLEDLWDNVDFVDDNTLSVNITRLRKKLEELNIYDSIETKRGIGYIMKKTWR